MYFKYLLKAVAAATILCGQVAIAALPTATIDSGVIIGTTTSVPSATAVVNQFLGIPFAASPPKRFEPPQSAPRSNIPLKTQAWKPACVQQFNFPAAARNFTIAVFDPSMPEESEDCLYLNVYVPAAPAPPGGRAVMFWIYGGSLQFGTAGQPTYDGSFFAGYEDVVIVTTNYRTNVFGFPSAPQLPLQGHNLGFLDQRFALDWVQRNIAQFGGSPDKVTIFGESAGAFSIDALLTSFDKNSKPPFRAAILESGQISYGPTSSEPSSVPAWNSLATLLNCTGPQNFSCVAEAPALTIKSIIEHNALIFNPVPDNVTLFPDPASRRTQREIAVIPTLSGNNAQEGRVFTFGMNDTVAFVEAAFPTLSQTQQQQIIAAYPIGSPGISDQFEQLSQIYTDFVFHCPEALYANATAESGIPAWRYFFNATFPNLQAFPDAGIFHSSEIPLVFRSFNKTTATEQENILSGLMQGAWASFAKNPALGPGWNAVGTGASFAGGANGLDVSVIQPIGFELEQQTVVDSTCGLYAAIDLPVT